MLLWVLIILFILLLGLSFAALRKAGGGSFPWLHFYAKGKESGFTFKEVNLLRKVAVENRLRNPTSLFWSINQIDRSIRGMIIKFKNEETLNSEESIHFLSKLFDFRKSVEMDLPKYKLGLKSTRKLPNRQRILINLPGVGTYNSQIVENLRRYMAISYPEGPKLPPGFVWRGRRINIYFWRQDDAGYVFESRVLEDYLQRKYPILHISHSDSLVRSQKRRSVRVETNKPAQIFPNAAGSEPPKNGAVQSGGRGLRCRLRDVSEDGAALIIGGRGKIGMPLRLQFHLGNNTILMDGVVKGVRYNQPKNQSILHIQVSPLSAAMRNRILIFVYNIFNERER
ncbi:MAG TPA: PilZ domain-containing protein [Sediminispirochaeta sp.]|nr:PilZ domain-containing protein [Sediminispirochaeta sp.]